MYRGEFEDSRGKTINFDIQDVGGGFVYDFPAMKSVSVASADAFVLGKGTRIKGRPKSQTQISEFRAVVVPLKGSSKYMNTKVPALEE